MISVTTRLALATDAPGAVDAVRRSITELCVADHRLDAPTLERWLRNKTPEHFITWCESPDNRILVAELAGSIAGVGALHSSGEIRLCYVRPEFARSGVGSALLLALEARARDWQIASLRLESSLTARRFYERRGFVSAGDSVPLFGVLRGYPYVKAIEG